MMGGERRKWNGWSVNIWDFLSAIFPFKEMFIVRDHREIPQILKDPKDERTVLSFSRR